MIRASARWGAKALGGAEDVRGELARHVGLEL